MAAKLCGILLAAGASTRFGSDKLLHPLADGTPIAVAALASLRTAVPHVIAVVRPGAATLEHRLSAAGATVILCAHADDGMGASLASAVAASGGIDGWLVALADMPAVRSTTVAAVRAALERGALTAAPYFQGGRGHPVGFARACYDELVALQSDQGARGVLRAHPPAIVDVDDPGCLLDIDTPT